MTAHVLVIGGGGREHALAWKIAQSCHVGRVSVAPGNAGTLLSGKICNVVIPQLSDDWSVLVTWCEDNKVSLVVVGPEDPLAGGIADVLKDHGIACFGPSTRAAEIESSKEFAKTFMDKYNIPTAQWKSFSDVTLAHEHISSCGYSGYVVKASGLAAGKGVVVCDDAQQARHAATEMLCENKFGAASSTILVEELLEGYEVSCLALTDGNTVRCFPPAQDHKRVGEGDTGPNTGGMGAYCPCPLIDDELLKRVEAECVAGAVRGLASEGRPYVGVLYAGVMVTRDGPRVLEYNCRFGDPETQVLLPLLSCDLYLALRACVEGRLDDVEWSFHKERHAVAVVTVAAGYPGAYTKGAVVTGLDAVERDGGLVFHAGTRVSAGEVVTSGGRVLAAVAVEATLRAAAARARYHAHGVQYAGKAWRRDIAHRALRQKGLSYASAGVDIGAGDALVEAIKPLAAATLRQGCQGGLGGFGAVFDVKAAGFADPLLVSGTDGVGTKLKVAQQCGVHDTVGVDLVAMCVNDVLCHGAAPLYFLDYLACGVLDVGVAKDVVAGVARACQACGCALVGGETAEMPGMYARGEYDLAGFAVGAVERHHYLPRMADITEDDVVIAISSSGVHSNGFSLVRKVLDESGLGVADACPWAEGRTVGEELLTPTSVYVQALLPSLREGHIKGLAHITGGGLPGNVARALPAGLDCVLDAAAWRVPPVFGWLANQGNISAAEMARTFNLGVGMVAVVAVPRMSDVIERVMAAGHWAALAGRLRRHTEGSARVVIDNLSAHLAAAWTPVCVNGHARNDATAQPRIAPAVNGHQHKRVAVLISGSGTNLQALIDDTQRAASHPARIVLVVSNKLGAGGLQRAAAAGIHTQVIEHAAYASRDAFDAAVHAALLAARVDIVCLAGFMRILTGEFVRSWRGRMINIHPSLLPAFKGAHAQKAALDARVAVSGATVHFVAEDVDSGAILAQAAVPVHHTDTQESLAARILTVEHAIYPRALRLVASGAARLAHDNTVTWTS